MQQITIGARPLTPEEVVAVARHDAHVTLAPEALARMAESRAVIEGLAEDPEPHYGGSTGIRARATQHLPVEQGQQRQRSLIRSHAASSGREVEREIVRGTMLLRLQTLATG